MAKMPFEKTTAREKEVLAGRVSYAGFLGA